MADLADHDIAACDGASKGNPGPAGWAWVLAGPDGRPVRWEAGPLGRATNNVAELTALAELLSATDPSVPLQVRMDSQYAMNAVTRWLDGWRRRGWKTSSGGPVANRELIVRIDAALAGRSVEFVYVAAHQVDGDPLNAIADRAASDCARAQQPAGTRYGAAAPEAPAPAAVPAAARPAASRSTARAAAAPAGRRGAGGDTEPRGGAGGDKPPRGTIAARFPGRCRCGGRYAAGDPIARNPDGWGHPHCRTDDA